MLPNVLSPSFAVDNKPYTSVKQVRAEKKVTFKGKGHVFCLQHAKNDSKYSLLGNQHSMCTSFAKRKSQQQSFYNLDILYQGNIPEQRRCWNVIQAAKKWWLSLGVLTEISWISAVITVKKPPNKLMYFSIDFVEKSDWHLNLSLLTGNNILHYSLIIHSHKKIW